MGRVILAVILFAVCVSLFKMLNRMVTSAAHSPREQDTARILSIVGRVVLAAGIVVPALIVVFSTLKMIPAGHVGVATLFGSVQPRPLYEGLNLINPLLDVTKMSVQVQKRHGKYDAASKDLQAVHVEMVLNYRLLPDQAPHAYQNIGMDFAEVIIDPAAQEVLKANTALHVASEILHSRPQIKADVQESLAKWLARYGIELKEAALANIGFDTGYTRAIEAKQIEEQKAEQKRYELIQAQRQAEIAAAQAKGQGDAARERAIGEADALRVKGEAEATYNAKVAASLTPTLIQQQYLSRWDGKLPVYMLGGGSNLLLQLPVGETGSK